MHLEMWGIKKTFGAFTALKEISFKVHRGEMVCLLGPSGCGKTTALRVIAGLEDHDSGRVFIGGRDVSHMPISKRNVGIVFQSYALFPNLTVEGNVTYGLHGRGMSRQDMRQRAAGLLDLVGLPQAGEKYPAQLSGGQQQRVALARAMALSPDVLLLDEPLSALDAKVRVHLRSEIKKLQRELGVTSILVTHDQEEAMTMADRILLMEGGSIVQDATPDDLYDHPATVFAAGFLGSMNFLPVSYDRAAATAAMGQARLRVPDEAARGDVGTRAVLGIRPEDVMLVEDGRGIVDSSEPNLLAVRADSLEFRGALYRMRLVAEEGSSLEQALFADVTARQVRRMGLGEGSRLRVCLPLARLHLFPGATDEAMPDRDAA
ncbi:putative 2-aminoethylphosphonate ABC transporter ATP-binding protein [Desulfovibrio sulfodismutans]|uniref:Putative 2-aminoethylphosphonate ABC transporter ATP-binding protein n=1 Tax=Desulfolutivibrio sulfodismutans TaxID=63561 RepID=A0A7K3NRZ2_9BACT|nr:putative 2-aminoethylphosphonate ABC transporter ATP-binding protein [Desulfolutivibrio sulfodismutans]